MPGSASRSKVVTRVATPVDLPAVLELVRQHRVESHAEDVLRAPPVNAAAPASAGCSRTAGTASSWPSCRGRRPVTARRDAVGLAVLGLDPLSLVLGTSAGHRGAFVVHREHRRCGVGALLLAAAAGYARRTGRRTSSPRSAGRRRSASASSPGWASRR